MLVFGCFSMTGARRKKDKEDKPTSNTDGYYEKIKTLQGIAKSPAKLTKTDELELASSIISINPSFNTNIKGPESPIEKEVAYEGEDEQEQDENLSMKRENSDFDFQSHIVGSSEENYPSMFRKIESYNSLSNVSDKPFENKPNRDDDDDFGFIQSGHVSDPGMRTKEFWASPKLVRSCSLVETNEFLKTIAYELPSAKDKSYEDLQKLAEKLAEKMHTKVLQDSGQSPRSVMTHHSADRVMLKKHSSSQVLPSRSRRLWWKLFLWSHRNIQKPLSTISKTHSLSTALNQQGGYCSDNLEPNRASELIKTESSPNSYTELSMDKGKKIEDGPCWDSVSGFWPQNQWVAFSAESPLPRVNQWVQELANQPMLLVDNDDDEITDTIDYPPSPETSRAPSKNTSHLNRRLNLMNISEEIMHANSIIQSLNLSSTVAHMTGVGLKVIPTLSHFHSLRSVNLSGNSIAHVTPGSLPKGLHTLNLSRNKITAIEGLRELTRLRVLDLSYNKISRIAHGLSNCTLIKELYLAGNKISEVEGVHRLLKLSVLDLSFNKISTTKALGQLVANYNTLLALNLLGNAVLNTVSDDQLRKAVCGLLPKLAYLNRQPVNSQKARDVATESIVKAALGNSTRSSRKKGGVRKVSQARLGSTSSQTTSKLSSRGRVRRH